MTHGPSAGMETSVGREPAPLELTIRAIAFGGVVGAALGMCNVYAGLKVGFIGSGPVPAAGLGYAFFSPWRRTPYTSVENNVTATTSASAANMCSTAGIAGPIAALAMLGRDVAPWAIAVWGLALAVLGTLIMIVLHRQFIAGE